MARQEPLQFLGRKTLRPKRQQTDTVVPARRHDLPFHPTVQEIVTGLAGRQRRISALERDFAERRDLPPGEIGAGHVAHLALAYQIVKRAQGFFPRRGRIRFVGVQQIDVVYAQTPQRAVDAVMEFDV